MKGKTRKEIRKEFRQAKKARKHEYFCKKKSNNFKKGKKNFQDVKVPSKGQNEKFFKKNFNNEKTPNTFVKKPFNNEKPPNKFVKKTFNNEKNPNKFVKKSFNYERDEDNFVKKKFSNIQERQEYELKKEKKEKETLEREIREQRTKQLKEDNLKEEIEIKKLEKQLKMRNGKSKLFAIDGLDYLLDVCDKKLSDNNFEKTFDDSGSDFEHDLDDIVGKPKVAGNKVSKKEEKNIKKKDEESEEDEELDDEEEEEGSLENESVDDEEGSGESGEEEGFEDDEEEDNDDDDDEKGLGDLSEDEEEDLEISSENESVESDSQTKQNSKLKRKSGEDKKVKNKKIKFDMDDEEEEEDEEKEKLEEIKPQKSKKVSKMWEDIYGRTRDEKGNIIKTYVPPQLRQKEDSSEKNNAKLLRLKKELKGLLNRLAESNMVYISNQIEQKYMSNSRNDMNETLYSLFYDSLFSEVLTPERLIVEHAMLVTVLHLNIGSEIGAYFLQHSVMEFNTLLQNNPPVEDKKIDNVLLFITHLYNFQIFHSKLIYGMINELLKNLEEKQIDLLVTTLRTVGFNLRKDDPVALKALVIDVQKKANSLSTGENSFRVKFMLEMLMAIKNNNVSKIPNYNPEFVEKLRKNLKLIVRKGNYNTELNISFQDLLNAEKHGRWWIVGSAWSNASSTQPEKSKEYESSVEMKFSQKLLDLAKKQRMNTDIRRDIFCIMMSAEDFLDAFEKLISLKLKGVVEREIINILLHCVMQEEQFNPYYVCLANKFCLFDRKYQVMLQCSIWDKIKELGKVLPVQITNFAKFVGNVILKKGLPISILKVIQFSDLDKPTIKFMRQLVLTILLDEDRNSVAAVFKRIADSNKLKLFKESLRLFLQHFIVKNTKNIEEGKVSRLKEMVEVADHALKNSDVQITF